MQRSIYDKFMEKAVARVNKIKQGNPLDPSTMIGAQASNDQLEKILSYVDIGKKQPHGRPLPWLMHDSTMEIARVREKGGLIDLHRQ